MPPEKQKEIIGRTILVDLPKLGFTGILAKADTGAYYCSLHCNYIRIKNIETKPVLCFKLLDPTHPEYQGKIISYKKKKYRRKTIKNSFGKSERRYFIRTTIQIHDRKIKAWVSLTKSRRDMKHPMLLGSRLLKNKFIVDVSLKEKKPI